MAEPFISIEQNGIMAHPVARVSSATDGKQRQKPQQDFKSFLQRFLDNRKETLGDTLEKNDEVRNELERLRAQRQATEIIHRMLPDGTVMVTRYESGRIVSRFFKRPHFKEVPDESKPIPRAVDGTRLKGQQKMKLVIKRALFDDLFG